MSHYKYHVFICTNARDDGRQSCEDCGASALRGYLKKKIKEQDMAGKGGVRINTAGCLDRCNEGPVMVVYPEETWYSYVDEEDLDEIFDSHLLGGKPVDRLKI